MFRDGLFSDKVAVVTGGGTGIGYQIAKDLAYLGATVVIASRKLEVCEAAAAEINAQLTGGERRHLRGSVLATRCNIRDPASVEALVEFVLDRCSRLDLLVNNSGGQFLSAAEDISPNGWAAVVSTNLNGTFSVCREAFQQWMADHGGSIVNIVVASANGYPGMCHSGAARAGVENMTKTLAVEWAASGVRVNCVAPGVIFTASGATNYGDAVDTLLPKLLRSIPARRCGTAEEVSAAVVFLLSPGASYVTGTTSSVDGGGGLTYMPLANEPDTCKFPVYGELNPKAKL